MAKKKYRVTLSPEEHNELEHLIRQGKASARKLTRARILLKAAAQQTDGDIAHALGVGVATVERTRLRFVEGGLAALSERPRPGKVPKLDARAEARLIAEACSSAPDGRERWTLQLLADRVVTLQLAREYSDESVRRVLKKLHSSRG
jgi:transposase